MWAPSESCWSPWDTLSFEEAYEIYGQMVRAGEEAGVDLVVFETMTDLGEVPGLRCWPPGSS